MDMAYKAEVMKRLDDKVTRMIQQIGDKSPHFAEKDGIYDHIEPDWWTSGFWPGLLWLLHDFTGKQHYQDAVWHWDKKLAEYFITKPDKLHHDVGFQFLPTAVIKHTITGDKDGERIGLQAANFLAGRYNPAGQYIRAWNDAFHGWAIIDCMLNVSLLFWATRVTGDPRYKHIAMKHADTALRYSIREDGSVNHILSFDPESGEFIEAIGGQGLAANSAWSRGTAWAINGFANTYRNTSEIRYLHAAKHVAHFFIASLPDDHVPYWDFRLDSLEGEPRDTSAAAIAASGLLEIAELVPASERRTYFDAAERILHSLTENYSTWDKPEHQAILIGGTGHKPAGNYIDGSLIYGDYYYAEAFAKLNGWKNRIF
jgi:unsaturated chondroitin disaccharide hydrolase